MNQELLNTCGSITLEELDMTLEVANKTIFCSKHMIINLMVGRVKEIINQTHKARVQFFVENPGFFSSPKDNPKTDTTDISTEGKGKGVVGAPPIILKDTKELDEYPPTKSNVQEKEEIRVKVDNVHIPLITNTIPSGKATIEKEDFIKGNEPEEKVRGRNLEGKKEK